MSIKTLEIPVVRGITLVLAIS